MQPVDATSGARSLTTVRVAAPSSQTARTDSVVEQIPVVEPRPHYPVSASVAEIMAHITELIKEQQTASQEALHQKNLDEARAEMERLFEAVRGQTDDTVNNKKADYGSVVKVDVSQISEIDDQTVKVSGDNENPVTSVDKSGKEKNAEGVFARQAKGVDKKSAGTFDVNVTSKTNGDLSPLPSDSTNADKKAGDVRTERTHKANLSEPKGKVENIPNNQVGFDQHPTVDSNNAELSTAKEDI